MTIWRCLRLFTRPSIMRCACWIGVICGLFILAPCIAGEDGIIEVRGSEGSTVISFTNGFGEVSTKGDQEIVATLPSNPTTGYRWQLMKPLAESTVKLVSNVYRSPQTGLVGAGGEEIWVFRTMGPGEAEIALGYLRSWEKGIPPVNSRTIRLKVSP
ncbi:MAG: protease inhibitor I42 family protein [Syntrophales bacterium]